MRSRSDTHQSLGDEATISSPWYATCKQRELVLELGRHMGRQQPLAFALSSDPTHFALLGMQMTVLGPAFGQRQIIDEKAGIVDPRLEPPAHHTIRRFDEQLSPLGALWGAIATPEASISGGGGSPTRHVISSNFAGMTSMSSAAPGARLRRSPPPPHRRRCSHQLRRRRSRTDAERRRRVRSADHRKDQLQRPCATRRARNTAEASQHDDGVPLQATGQRPM